MPRPLIYILLYLAVTSSCWFVFYGKDMMPELKFVMLDRLYWHRAESRLKDKKLEEEESRRFAEENKKLGIETVSTYHKVFIIARDDDTLSYVSKMPEFENMDKGIGLWRLIFARVINRLSELYPRSVSFDFVFEDRCAPEINEQFENSLKKLSESSKIVLATKIYQSDTGIWETAEPYKEISSLAFRTGHINQGFDEDQIYRNATLIIDKNDGNENSLSHSYALQTFVASAEGFKDKKISIELEKRENRYVIIFKDPEKEKKVLSRSVNKNLNIFEIPIVFTGTGSENIEHIPMYYFLDEETWKREGKRLESELKDSTVFVGPTSAEDQDFVNTPVGRMTGVELHANAFESLINTYGYFQNLTLKQEFVIFITVMTLFFLLFVFLNPWQGFLTYIFGNIFMSGLYVTLIVGFIDFLKLPYYVDPLRIMLSVLALFLTVFLYKFVFEQKEKYRLKKMFSNYVSAEVVNELIKFPDKIKLGGEKRELSILFSDVAGFTTISESMSPEGLVLLLNEYLGSMTDIVLENDGTLDKFIGDAVMAFWGAPLPDENHPVKACRTALLMLEKLTKLQQSWKERNLPNIDIRIGINTGEVVVGNVGSEKRMDYTVLGDSVNTAARLEPACKQYGVRILISGFTMERVKDNFVVREVDSVRVKGKLKPIGIFELICEKGKEGNLEHIHIFEEAVVLYKQMKWDEAVSRFEDVLAIKPDDKTSEIYIKRCKEYKQDPPPSDWDGVYVMTTK